MTEEKLMRNEPLVRHKHKEEKKTFLGPVYTGMYSMHNRWWTPRFFSCEQSYISLIA
jgi:hypothetical protein